MKLKVLSLLAVLLSPVAHAQEAAGHKNGAFIPIPPCSLPYGDASGASSFLAAEAFLATFDDAQKARFMFALDAPERKSWSNLPADLAERKGLSVGEMSDEQRRLLFDFLSSSLGALGYDSVVDLMAAEASLSAENATDDMQWNPENYWISFYGTPAAEGSWAWQFGGPHLGLNLSIEDGKVKSMSPSFIGAVPEMLEVEGVDYNALGDMQRAGYAVFEALDSGQKAQADAGELPEALLTGPGRDGEIPDAIGLDAAQMTPEQKVLLLETIGEWVRVQPGDNARLRMDQLASELDQTRFAWTGGGDMNTPVYMRIQGPSLIIELLLTGKDAGKEASGQGQYHTVYRNPTLEYGRKN